MAYYQKHVFFCNNQRDDGRRCCANHNALELRNYMKQCLKDLSMSGYGKHRVNLAGCMGRCKQGPVMVVYPEGTWYSYKTIQDIDEIIQSHLIEGKIVERLMLPNELVNN